jgi:hypothetical protein
MAQTGASHAAGSEEHRAWMELFIRASSFRKRDCEPSSGVYVVANISVGSIDDIFDWYGLKR